MPFLRVVSATAAGPGIQSSFSCKRITGPKLHIKRCPYSSLANFCCSSGKFPGFMSWLIVVTFLALWWW